MEEENDNPCEKDAATTGEEERSFSAPLVLSQERMEEVCRRLHSLQEQLKRLQVRRDEPREMRVQRKTVSREYDGGKMRGIRR